ncbi:MFS transporter [Parashewanella tropica]|uniref:MFS transporter n=1 Tax=Parashewanella tropica TaxID=2547970 RepID=UPI00105943E3|nr:MFS transporter [Parashewanella tropica]
MNTNSKQIRLISLLNVGHFLTHYLVLIYPTLALFLIKPWHMSYSELLKLGSLSALMYGVGVLPSGWLSDKFGRGKMMLVFFFGSALACFAAGLSQNSFQLTISIGFIGLFSAIYHPVGLSIIYGASNKAGRVLAINGVFGNLGMAVAAFATSLIASNLDWRWALYLPGTLCLLAGLFYISHTRCNVEYQKQSHASQLDLPLTKMRWIFTCILITASCGGLVFNSLTTGLPKILRVESSFSTASLVAVGGMATLILVVASIAQLLIGELLHRIAAEKLLFIVVIFQVLTLGLISVFGFSLYTLGVCLFFNMAQLPINDFIIGKYAQKRWRALFYGVKYTLSLGSSPVAYWLLATSFNPNDHFTSLFYLLFCFSFISMLTVILLISCSSASTPTKLKFI